MRYIELLAPAKDFEAAKAAIDHGADAIYMGAARFGARRGAANSIEEIARAVEYAHQYGVRVHSTMNTVLYDEELAQAKAQAEELIAAGIDALIIQDMALREMGLDVELHASTQVGNTTPEGAKFLEECGFSRIILERALSLEEIRAIRQATTAELECFIHGAICVGHSGRCFLSRSTSNRSGNRGECSQPCRLPYDLRDSNGRLIMQGKHLLSVKDMDLTGSLEELIDAGITSFKIEGRLKDNRYIKNIVSHYRKLLDQIISRRDDLRRQSFGRSIIDFEPNPAKSFTRGGSEYMLHGRKADVASFDTPKAIGEYIGQIAKLSRRGFFLDKKADLSPADGICAITPNGLFGTNINTIEGEQIIPNRMDGITLGAKIFRNYDHSFTMQLERSRTRRVIGVEARLRLSKSGCELWLKDEEGIELSLSENIPLSPSNSAEKMADTARKQIAKCGGTIFELRDIHIEGGEFFAPASLISELRRRALEELRIRRIQRALPHNILHDNGSARYPSKQVTRYENVTNSLSEKFYLKHGVEQIETALETLPTSTERVMISTYCIRREIGECLKENPRLKAELYIEHGYSKYRLEFDCKRCLMSLYDCSIKPQNKE